MNKIYRYDITTKEFIQELEINEAYGTNLPFTTAIKPPAKKEGFAVCFNGTKWEFVEDNRNKTVYVKATKEELKVDYLGKIKDEHTLLIPKQFDEWDYTQNKWVENIEKKETQRIQEIEAKCNQAIEAVYPIYKQINITNLLTPYTEEDRETMKSFIDNKRVICHKAIADGTKPEDVDFSDES